MSKQKQKSAQRNLSNSDPNDRIQWKFIFIEVALRAIRQVHFDYSRWGVTQQQVTKKSLNIINQGPGIEWAHETAVMAVISQEFLNSRFTNGVVIANEPRQYQIDREVLFRSKSKNKKSKTNQHYSVDLVLHRIKDIGKTTHHFKFPVFLEAKRAVRYKPILNGKLESPNPQWSHIIEDVEKLKTISDSDLWEPDLQGYEKAIKKPFLCILFWGYIDDDKTSEIYDEIEKGLGSYYQRDSILIRWMPLQWESTPKVTKWLWLALMEIGQKEFPDESLAINWEPPLSSSLNSR